MSMPHCKGCGAEIAWKVIEETGRYAPPMIALSGTVMTLGPNGMLVPSRAYIKHRCDSKQQQRWEAREKVAAQEHQTRAERAATAKEQEALDRALYVSMRDEAYSRAAHVDCPKCPAKEGEECLNLNHLAGRTGRGKKHTSWPHPERVLLAEQEGH